MFHCREGLLGLLDLAVANFYVEGLAVIEQITVSIDINIFDGVSMRSGKHLHSRYLQRISNGIGVVGKVEVKPR